MLCTTFASAVEGVDARMITVEVNAGGQVKENAPWYHVVGLPDSAIREGSFRIDAAMKNSGYKPPTRQDGHQLGPRRYP